LEQFRTFKLRTEPIFYVVVADAQTMLNGEGIDGVQNFEIADKLLRRINDNF
jgi:hypothetical protein